MYLSNMTIENFRGISSMNLSFKKDINIIIGENGAHKSTIIDAIRLLYNFGVPYKQIYIKNEDFFTNSETGESEDIISITYEFRGLTEIQKGTLYEYIIFDSSEDYASITINYERRQDKHPKFNYFTGGNPGQRANSGTFEIFQHYFLGALRDSTSDLLSPQKNLLAKVIKRSIDTNNSEQEFKDIMTNANSELLGRDEVSSTKENINSNLNDMYSSIPNIGLHIEQSKIEPIVNAIKPFLPFSNPIENNTGLSLFQNSLGYNNLIYIATVLSDMNDRVNKDETIHHALLIEEPEAHLHPQLQLNLYNFLKDQICNDNCQLFITSHSPTLTSKTELEKLFTVDTNSFKCVGEMFEDRVNENLTQNNRTMNDNDFLSKRKMLERYLDVTKSQMLYAKSLILVEGISEELLLSTFAEFEGFKFEEKDIELVQTGTSFYPFLLLFNSTDENKRIAKKVSVVTDDDRFTDSKKAEYSFDYLVLDDYNKLNELRENISNSAISSRINNLNSFKNGQENIETFTAYKTFEYEITKSNVPDRKEDIFSNLIFLYLVETQNSKLTQIQSYIEQCPSTLTDIYKTNIAMLMWKALPSKAEFAQDFAYFLLQYKDDERYNFNIPNYIRDSFNHLR
ncbi:ATP-dependent nuclease [Gracilibacillus dipsosauri]|uniref:ATP-dependent endonuclease n=1 Tax=Gracilibacillus dipsosauri TaxID=178340 RepID=A0A317L561_9BACI|nr:AAA family ATPase [Gracilibacillus dipsosauri]PWU70434.1 ATP-dependent endonuclease [Gracilibacillus dipsosauri]